MMSQTTEFGYVDGGSFQGVELPYVGDDLSMVLLVPKANDGLPVLEKQLTGPKLDSWTSQLHSTRVSVSLPKFRLTLPLELVPVLKQLGMAAAFHGADFSGMNGKRDLAISNVVHKAFVDVNEEGTEAAAASGVMMSRAAVARPRVVRADHPFLFLIRERKAGSVLFLGRLAEPAE
jgi:serpin B